MASKKEQDRKEVREFTERFSRYTNEKLLEILHLGFGNKAASQAISILLKERGIKQ